MARLRSWWKRPWLRRSRSKKTEPIDLAPSDAAWAYHDLGHRLLDAVESLCEYPDRREGALVLLRETVLLGLAARVVRVDPAALPWVEQATEAMLWTRFTETQAGRELLERFGTTEASVAREAVVDGRGHQLVRVASSRRDWRVRVLRRLAHQLLHGLERERYGMAWAHTRRRLRIAALVLILIGPLAVVWLMTAAPVPTKNLAAGKPVTPSSQYKLDYYPPEKLVDGDRDEIGFHTDLEDNPKVTIDLLRPETVSRMVVVNRQDMLQERAVPLIIETSEDGTTYRPFARRDEEFMVWEAKGQPVRARYVRLWVPKRIEFHLNEVEIY